MITSAKLGCDDTVGIIERSLKKAGAKQIDSRYVDQNTVLVQVIVQPNDPVFPSFYVGRGSANPERSDGNGRSYLMSPDHIMVFTKKKKHEFGPNVSGFRGLVKYGKSHMESYDALFVEIFSAASKALEEYFLEEFETTTKDWLKAHNIPSKIEHSKQVVNILIPSQKARVVFAYETGDIKITIGAESTEFYHNSGGFRKFLRWLNTVPCSKEIRELATTWLNLSQEKCGEDIMNRTTFEDPTVYRNERKDFKNYPRKAAAPRAEPVNVDDDEIGVSVRTV